MFRSYQIRAVEFSRPRRLAVVLAPALLAAPIFSDGGPMRSAAGEFMGVRGASAQAANASSTGIVNAVDLGQRKVKLTHEAIPALKWPSMTMDFPVAAQVDLTKLKPGTKVQFTLSRAPSGYVVDSVSPAQ